MFALLLAALLAGPAALPSPIRVGMETRQPPWTFVPGQDVSGEDFRKPPSLTPAIEKKLVGIDIDVARALERRLGTPIKIVPSVWWDLEQNLLDGRFDLILSSWTASPRTPSGVVASEPYWEWGLQLAVRADDEGIGSFADLDGKKVGHYRDPAVERSLLALSRGQSAMLASDSPDDLFLKLAAKSIDAVVFDSPYVRWRAAVDRTIRMVGEPLNRLGYQVGLRRNDAALLQRVQDALKAMRADGELDRLRRKWESAEAPR